ncbi:MAG: queuine tRNA-ribosyltransferase [Legionella sp.]|nr:MAG: queuine tRNA-ribosyltransferase [Legionella sp.]
MWTTSHSFIPMISSEAGSSLTTANWQEVGIETLAYTLEDLLLKPGYSILMRIADCKKYLAWPGRLVLNASNLARNKEGIYTIVSPYDGSKMKFNSSELIALLCHLNPDMILLPKGLEADWPESILTFIPVDEAERAKPTSPFGVYFVVDSAILSEQFYQRFAQWAEVPRYIINAPMDSIIELAQEKNVFLESNLPAEDALNGRMYAAQGLIDLQDPQYALCFDLLDEACSCPTCTQRFTQAYLHHLLGQTPLLCQRFLIQHNISQIVKRVKS